MSTQQAKMATNGVDFNEIKNYRIAVIKQKMNELGLDTRGTKAELLTRLEHYLKDQSKRTGSRGVTVTTTKPVNAKSSELGVTALTPKSRSSDTNLTTVDMILDECHNSIYCEGLCSAWIHQGCAGLSKAAHSRLKDSSQPFQCPACRLDALTLEIVSLKESLASLKLEMSSMKSQQESVAVLVNVYCLPH